MFVILFYDVAEERVSKMLKICRKYLIWQQNSVFEGEISLANLEKLKMEIYSLVKEEDSVIIYTFRSLKYSQRLVIGKDKREDINFL